jgi:uncharacterized protein (DUF2141 family)
MTAFITFLALFFAQNEVELKVNFTGMEHSKGKVLVELRNEKNVVVQSKVLPVKNETAFTIFNVRPGKYAISSFYDANNNTKLDKNFLGAPTEKYGFSNNARGTFGPPDFKDQLVEVNETIKIDIQLK